MANSRLFQFSYSYERDLAHIVPKISIGASGAPTIVNGKGVVSVVRNSAGNYTLTLKDPFYLLMGVSCTSISGSSAPAAPILNVVSETVNSTKTIIIQLRDSAGVATDPASGEILMMHILLRMAST